VIGGDARHPSADALEAYVLDLLAPHEARALEQHVRVCEACAGALAAEARREVALEALLPRVATARRPMRPPAPSPWLSPFLLAATGALGLVITAANPGAIRLADGPSAPLAQAACFGPASETALLCLAGGGEAGMCRRPMSVELDPPRAARQWDNVQLFSCSGCSCPAELPR
jgi:anti-sigma factor RsiW